MPKKLRNDNTTTPPSPHKTPNKKQPNNQTIQSKNRFTNNVEEIFCWCNCILNILFFFLISPEIFENLKSSNKLFEIWWKWHYWNRTARGTRPYVSICITNIIVPSLVLHLCGKIPIEDVIVPQEPSDLWLLPLSFSIQPIWICNHWWSEYHSTWESPKGDFSWS